MIPAALLALGSESLCGGKMRYYVPDLGQTPEDAADIPVGSVLFREAMERAARHFADLPGFQDCRWPLHFVVTLGSETRMGLVHKRTMPYYVADQIEVHDP